jgi:hypothetical protein
MKKLSERAKTILGICPTISLGIFLLLRLFAPASFNDIATIGLFMTGGASLLIAVVLYRAQV